MSTVGVAPRIKQLADDAPKVNLALSLHVSARACVCGIAPLDHASEVYFILRFLGCLSSRA